MQAANGALGCRVDLVGPDHGRARRRDDRRRAEEQLITAAIVRSGRRLRPSATELCQRAAVRLDVLLIAGGHVPQETTHRLGARQQNVDGFGARCELPTSHQVEHFLHLVAEPVDVVQSQQARIALEGVDRPEGSVDQLVIGAGRLEVEQLVVEVGQAFRRLGEEVLDCLVWAVVSHPGSPVWQGRSAPACVLYY